VGRFSGAELIGPRTGQHDRCILNHLPDPVSLPPSTGCSAEANLKAALVLLQRLMAHGLRRLVLCPGSRSAPLAVAAGLLADRGLDLLTGVDERSAAFLAVGLGRAEGLPAAVITTSGTAVANLLPAAVEADNGAVPLLLLSADRPARLKNCGANQTVCQEAFLAPCCRRLLQADPAGLAVMPRAAVQRLADQAWGACLGAPAGPVHLNLPFEEPLHADPTALVAAAGLIEVPPPAQEPVADSTTTPVPSARAAAALGLLDPDRPGVVVAGPWRGSADALTVFADALRRWQRRSGWPVLADALSGLRGLPGLELIHAYDLLLAEGHGLPPAGQLLRLGPMPASRRLQQWIAASAGPQLLITEADPRNLDASGSASARWPDGLAAWFRNLPQERRSGVPAAASLAWARRWQGLDLQVQRELDLRLDPAATGAAPAEAPPPTEPAVARRLSRLLPAGLPLMLASSSPVRDWESFAAADGPARPLFGFRGASGIDGTLSLASGLACGRGRLLLLTGDLALLHDANGWLWRRQLETRGARLCVLVIDNGGGGIFEQLPIRMAGSPEPMDFERLFAMPQAIDHGALAAGYGIPARTVEGLDQLAASLDWALGQPMALLQLRTDRRHDAGLRQQLRRRMAALSAQA
jgi:2-succinyl-5-enolpyruvyl-6-hydroxy-3-cyclohexene-1-carboxylate synthase